MNRDVQWSRDALDDLAQQIAWIAADNPAAARRIATRLRQVGDQLGDLATGRPGRVTGTYERSVTGLPYIVAYAITRRPDGETVSILRVIRGARNWPEETWPD